MTFPPEARDPEGEDGPCFFVPLVLPVLPQFLELVKKINDFSEKILDKRDDPGYIISVAKLFCGKIINGTKEEGEEE